MKRSKKTTIDRCIAIVIGVLIATCAGCGKVAIVPVAIAAEDMCDYCRMAISEKQYAAEVIDREANARKFDDIGCMLEYLNEQRDKQNIAAYFVVDFSSREWLKAEDAVFVRSPELKTPMAGGIVAFKDASRAELAAGAYRGSVLRFRELFGS